MPASKDPIDRPVPSRWLRYLAVATLAVVFLAMSFLGGMVQRIAAETIPPGAGLVAAIAVCAAGWLMWRYRKR